MQAGLVDQQRASRWTCCVLKALPDLPEQEGPQTEEDQILAYVREHGSITNTKCRTALGGDAPRALLPPQEALR
jgi:hypothetical protein